MDSELSWELLDRLVAEHAELKDRTEPLREPLRRLAPRYEHAWSLTRFRAPRHELRSRIIGYKRSMDDIENLFREHQKRLHIQATTLGVATSLQGGSVRSGEDIIKRGMKYREPFRDMCSYSTSLGRDLYYEEAEFDKARARIRWVRLVLGIAGGFGAACLLLFLGARRLGRGLPPGGRATAPSAAAPAGPARRERLVEVPPPETIGGHFRIDGELGRGGMGVVFKALDTELERPVAVKRMREEVTQSKKELEMFLAEARLVAALKHPALVEIHSFFREEDSLYLVFELVEGEPLHEVLEKEGRLSLKRTLEILRPVAEGLDYAHSKRVIHRDLKPSNIMVCEDGAKIMDFGIAHQAKKTVAKVTHADAWGTPPYMAPEQELGTVTRESDLYALGVCVYEMLTGEPAFTGPDFLKQKREEDFTPPSKTGADLREGLDAVFARALASEPKERFHSAQELAEALAELLDG